MKLLVSALEPSANIHLKEVLKELGDVEISGIFDDSLGEPLYSSKEFGVMGFLDVIPKIMKAKEAIDEMAFLAGDVDKVLLMDSPAFNIPLAKAIKKKYPEKEITYYILPQVWAWKRKRVKVVEANCNNLASILPFEPKFYNKAVYVGNPLLDEIKDVKKSVSEDKITAFLPGSRKSEIKKLMPVFREVAAKLDGEKLIAVPSYFSKKEIDEIYGDLSGFEIITDAKEVLLRSSFAYVCSGTATLEAAIIGTPFVLVYKAKAIDYMIAKMFVKLKHVGLANIIMDFLNEESVHPELLQEEVNVQNLLKYYKELDREKFLENSLRLRTVLKHGSAKRVADMLR
ncbi:lipid-A-disaccharide synthase [Nitrosophilus alvini]|uniref:lipid-A-disaccharide synthase n=1 Tax=Nitrosophilus alvini TaxID=2714855 RepID=UPI00190E3779|nr:lipid-A-disaccharide synthase [Nitrosophilus alvini]